MDRLAAMQTFVRVAEAGSFTSVADELNVARSAVTRQIAALEAHLGVKLIARSTRRLSLTSAGAGYIEQCRDILDRIDEAEGNLAGAEFPRPPVQQSAPQHPAESAGAPFLSKVGHLVHRDAEGILKAQYLAFYFAIGAEFFCEVNGFSTVTFQTLIDNQCDYPDSVP